MMPYNILRHMTVHIKGYKKTILEQVMQEITATGFFAVLDIKGKRTSIILTAKHFAEDVKRVTFMLHYKENEALVTVPVSLEVKWHLCEDTDIAYCELKPIEERFRKITGKSIYATAVTQDDILTEEQLNEINILDAVIMAGYPQGVASTHHKYPLFAKGHIASLPKDSLEDDEGYVDISAVGGFSGSPLFLETSELKFLGILVGGISDDSSASSGMCLYVPSYKILRFLNPA